MCAYAIFLVAIRAMLSYSIHMVIMTLTNGDKLSFVCVTNVKAIIIRIIIAFTSIHWYHYFVIYKNVEGEVEA